MIKPRLLPSHFELETQSIERNMWGYRTSSNQQSFQTMFPDMEQPGLQTGNPVAPAFLEQEVSTERQNITTSSSGVTQPSTPGDQPVLQRVYWPGDSLIQESNCAKC